MPRARESVGKALRRALGEEVVLPKIEPRQPGISHLMNVRRLRIYEMIFNEPGLHLREIQRKSKIPLQSLRWHVSVLLNAGVVESIVIGKRGVLFSPISVLREEVLSKVLARDARYGPIIDMIATRGSVSVKEIRAKTGDYQQLVSARLKALKARGVVESTNRGPKTRYKFTASAIPAVSISSADKKEKLLALLRSQGLAPKVSRHAGGKLAVVADSGAIETELLFNI